MSPGVPDALRASRPSLVCVIGAGYVGLTSGACLAALGNEVRIVEANPDRLAALGRGELPIVEPGLAEVVEEAQAAGRLAFTSEMAAVAGASVAMLCVGTPPRPDGDPDLRQLTAAAAGVAANASSDLVVVVKSTVPPGTCEAIELVCEEHAPAGVRIHVVSNPEFLREGSALEDFMHPDRVVIGASEPGPSAAVRDLYPGAWPITCCDRRSAELIKYASNTFLAVKISYANEIAALCESLGADAGAVLEGVGLDPRVGSEFLRPGPGFGGSCLGKDLSGLIAVAASVGLDSQVARAARVVNNWARARVIEKLESALGTLEGKRVAVLGLAFKPGTDDIRDSPAVHVIGVLAERGVEVTAFDPLATAVARWVERHGDPYEAVRGADAAAVLTAWPDLGALDPGRLRAEMRGAAVIDAVGILDVHAYEAAGLEVLGIERGTPLAFHPVILRPLEWMLA
jgi:UDPglucose 6-dehydrogenase